MKKKTIVKNCSECNRQFAINTMMHTDARKNNRGYVETVDAAVYEQMLQSPELKSLVGRIRNGEEALKDRLPWMAVHYSVFFDNKRDQAHRNKYSFTHRSCLDDDDPATVEQAFAMARRLNDDADSIWHGLIERLMYSARKKGHIDFRLPVGMTIEEAHERLARDLGIEYDKSVCSPERFIYQTSQDDVVWQSDRFYEQISYAEQQLREAAYQQRGLDVDGRPLQQMTEEEALKLMSNAPAPKNAPALTNAPAPAKAASGTQTTGADESLFSQAEAVAGVVMKDAREGERHETLKRLLSQSGLAQAVSREAIVEWVADVAPGWYHDDRQDIENLVRDFADKYKDTPVRVGQHEASGGETATTAERLHQLTADYAGHPLFKPTKQNFPSAVRTLLGYLPDDRLVPGFLCISPAFGMCCEQFEAEGPMGYLEKPLLQTFCGGESGAGKNSLEQLCNCIIEQALKADQAYRKADADYKQKLKGKSATESVQRPKGWVRILGLDATNAARAQLMTLGEGHILYMLESEAGLSMQQLEGSGFSPIKFLNNSWSRERVIIDRASEQGVSASVVPMLNITGFFQPKYLRFYSRFLEQGWCSRVMWTHIETKNAIRLQPIKRISESDRQAVSDFVARLMALPEQTLRLTLLKNQLTEWANDTLEQASAEGNRLRANVGIIGRVVANCMRCGVWLTAAWMVDGKKGGDSQTVARQMVALADYLLAEYELLFGSQILRNEQGNAFSTGFDPDSGTAAGDCSQSAVAQGAGREEQNRQILSSLPPVFTRKDLEAQKPGTSMSGIKSLIHRWLSAHLIESSPDGGYRKLC